MFWDQSVINNIFNLNCKTIYHATTENCQNIWEVVLSNMKPELTSRPAFMVTSSLADMLC